MTRGCIAVALVGIAFFTTNRVAFGQMRSPSPNEPPALEETPASPINQPGAKSPAPDAPPPRANTKEKLARVWANEPQLVRLARDKFGAELTETDAKFFNAVASNEWSDLRPSAALYNPEEPKTWSASPKLKADRINWLCTDPSAAKLVPSRGVWLRGVTVVGKVDLYRCDVPFSLTLYDCLLAGGLTISHAKLQELDIRNSCLAGVQARGAQIAENVYLLTTSVFGGLDFIDAQIGGDFDFSGGLALHGSNEEELKKKGIAINFHDAKVSGDLKLSEHFRALGQVRLIGTQIGRSLLCGNGRFVGGGQIALDARRANIGSNAVFTNGFRAEGGVEFRRAHVGGDLDCDGGRFIAPDGEAFDADLVNVGGQLHLGSGFHAEGEVRLVNATVGGDIDCDNGHFLNAKGDALSLDGALIGRSLRIGAASNSAKDETPDLPAGFLTRGTLRLWGTQVNQDVLASGAQFEAPGGAAIQANNLKVASRLILAGVKAEGTVNIFAADIEHELDLRCSTFDAKGAPNNIAIWANGMHVRGHVYCNQVDTPEQKYHFHVNGLASFQFATIAMHWDLYGAELINPGADALDASDCRVGGYVNIDTVAIDGRASFSRAKIDGMWIINKMVEPEKMRLDLRFAHIWVIKDERLDDWPPAGHLQLEGLVYDHFDDDSPLDVHDRLAWLRRQYAPRTAAATRQPAPPEASPISRAQTSQARERRAEIIPVQFNAPAMPAPSMSPPMPVPSPSSVGANSPEAPDDQARRQLVEQARKQQEEQAHKQMEEAREKEEAARANAAGMKAPAPTADATDENSEKSEAKTVETIGSLDATVDPAGRRYITQPYTQLASVYRAIGQDEQANDVLVARAERLGELAHPLSAQGLWYRYLGRLIGYGYEPFRAIKIGLAIIAMGALVFALGAHRGLMSETNLAERVLSSADESGIVSPTYPRFNALVYSLDVFLPFVDLNQVGYWIPGEQLSKPGKGRNCFMHIGRYSVKWSSVLHAYLWFQTLAGWTLCTLLAAAVTGIVQS
jgi:hypothetical protein